MRISKTLVFALWVLSGSAPWPIAAQPLPEEIVPLDDPGTPVATAPEGIGSQELPASEDATPDASPAAAEEAAPAGQDLSPALLDARAALAAAEAAAEGEEGVSLIDALEALALAEIAAGQHAAAESTLQREIDLLEKNFGVYSSRIAVPLAMLGEIYLDSGRYDEAIETFQRAQHIVHRADGVYTLEQLDYLDKISSSFVKKKKYAEADRHHRFSFFLSEHNYGPDSPELVPAIMRLGQWYRRVGNVREARILFERAANVLEQNYGPDYAGLVEPLLALGTTTQKKAQYRKQREKALIRVVEIVENDPGMDTVDKAAAWARLGDFYIMVDESSNAAEAYAKSWAVLRSDEALPEDSAGLLDEPRVLHFQRRIYLMEHTARGAVEGYDASLEEFPVDLEFEADVGSDGRVLKVRALNMKANASTRRQLRRYVREARFRPRIVDGQPVRTENFRFSETVIIVKPEGG